MECYPLDRSSVDTILGAQNDKKEEGTAGCRDRV
jgi:hypothetical protein